MRGGRDPWSYCTTIIVYMVGCSAYFRTKDNSDGSGRGRDSSSEAALGLRAARGCGAAPGVPAARGCTAGLGLPAGLGLEAATGRAAGAGVPGAADGDPGRVDRERGAAVDPRRSALLDDGAAVGGERVHADVRGLPAAGRARGGPAGAP